MGGRGRGQRAGGCRRQELDRRQEEDRPVREGEVGVEDKAEVHVHQKLLNTSGRM